MPKLRYWYPNSTYIYIKKEKYEIDMQEKYNLLWVHLNFVLQTIWTRLPVLCPNRWIYMLLDFEFFKTSWFGKKKDILLHLTFTKYIGLGKIFDITYPIVTPVFFLEWLFIKTRTYEQNTKIYIYAN